MANIAEAGVECRSPPAGFGAGFRGLGPGDGRTSPD